jgi:hypothetical protein
MSNKKTQSKPLTFRELEIGQKFIAFPTDGDDSGHGGFQRPSYLFIKVDEVLPALHTEEDLPDNAMRLNNGGHSRMPDEMGVLPID